jgi:hypothetical protein
VPDSFALLFAADGQLSGLEDRTGKFKKQKKVCSEGLALASHIQRAISENCLPRLQAAG